MSDIKVCQRSRIAERSESNKFKTIRFQGCFSMIKWIAAMEQNAIERKNHALTNIRVMKNLKPVYDKSLIYTRLGYDKKRTELSSDFVKAMERLFAATERALEITAAYSITGILVEKPYRVALENGRVLSGIKLAGLLENCDEALIMMATGGERIMELIRSLQAEGKLSEAVVVDAAASEITDAALDMVMAVVSQQLLSRGKMLTKLRFSPGYGDFDIEQQKILYEVMRAESFGIKMNEACLLIPEKSVLAIAGIGSSSI